MRVSLPFWLWVAHLTVPFVVGMITLPVLRILRRRKKS
jgi:hypothetical protein